MVIGDRVATIRKDSGLSQEAFSKRLQISRSYVSLIENGNKEPSAALRKLLCMEFYVNEEWLLTGKGEKYNQAAKDVFELDESGSGKDPKDRFGREKAEAIRSAAWLYSTFPNVASSCVSVDYLLMFLSDPEFCDLFNRIAVMYQAKVAGAGAMFDIVNNCARQTAQLGNLESIMANAPKNIKAHESLSITKYLHQIVEDQKIEDECYAPDGRNGFSNFIGLKEHFERMNK